MIISKWIASACVCASLAIGCGGGSGGSGVDGTIELVELDAGEAADLCDYIVDVLGPERTVDCGDGVMITVGGEDAAECVDDFDTFPATCTATVDNAEACAEALGALSDAQLCADDSFPAACAPLISGTCGGG